MRGDTQAVRTLLDKGDTQGKDKALVEAACRNHLEVAQLLLERGVSPNPNGGFSALHCAVRDQHPEMVSLLLKYGANPDYKSGLPTPLEWAERRGNDTIINLLRDARTKPGTIPANPPSPGGSTPSPPPIY